MISSVSGRYLKSVCWIVFHIAHTHPLGGLDVPFGVLTFDLNFLPSILTPLLTFRVRTGPGNPGKSLNLKSKNPGLESPGILLKVLESPGNLNSEKRD